MDVALARSTRERLDLERHRLQVVVEPASTLLRVEARGELRILRRDARGVLALVPVVVEAGGGADLGVLIGVGRIVVAQRDHRRDANRYGVRAKRECLGGVGAVADAAGDDELHLAVHAHLLQCRHGLADTRERRQANVLDEHVLRGGSTALHAVEHDHVGAGLHGQLRVVVRAARADLDVDRLLPVGDLTDLLDLDLEIVRAGPVGMTARGALVDALRQVAHLGNAIRDLLTEQHAAAARLCALADDDLDRVGTTQVIRVHAVARRQQLVDEDLRMAALLLCHAAVTSGRRRARHRGAAAEGLLGRTRQGAEAHAGDRDGDLEVDRLLREARAEHDVGRAPLAIALEGVARHRRSEEEQVVEVRQLALGAEAADVVDALARRTTDLMDRVAVEDVGLLEPWMPVGAVRAGGIEISHRQLPSTRRRCRC